jgi:hypothetical protein
MSTVVIKEQGRTVVRAPGIPGATGKSAYEIWIEEGNVGTEQDFLDSLVGADGGGVPNGGTTGQVLAKASNTDQDVEWVNQTGGAVDSVSAFLNARMTTAERNALTAVNGMQIYNTTDDKLQVYAEGSWVDLH